MPFEVFRRHQRKMLAVLAILAMVAFTLDFSLFRNGGGGPTGDPVVATLYGKEVHRSELEGMRFERLRANLFMQALTENMSPNFFGGTSDPEILDAMILDHEADKLKMPNSIELAKLWLRQITSNQLSTEKFDEIYRSYFNADPYLVTDVQLLEDIANQVRLQQVEFLPTTDARPTSDLAAITPLDLYQSYRDQNERVSAYAVSVPVDSFLDQVEEPTAKDIQAYFDKYKELPGDPRRDTPGFLSPHRVQAEYVMIDEEGLAITIEKSLTEDELRAYYEEHQAEFPPPTRELPLNLFAGDPEATLTPRVTEPFYEVYPALRARVAQERAQDQVQMTFDSVREQVMNPFRDQYDEVLDERLDAEEAEDSATADKDLPPLPKPTTKNGESLLKQFAARKDLTYEKTPLMTQEEAEKLVPVAGSTVGPTWSSTNPTFVSTMFDPRSSLYDPIEFADARGERYLAWKLQDLEPEVPKLDEVRPQVILAWKREQARPLAEKAAKAIAEKAREKSADLKSAAEGRRVIATSEVARMSISFDPQFFNPQDPMSSFGPPRPSEIPEIDNPSDALRDALFALKPGEVEVQPDASKTNYWVLALQKRTPADLSGLFRGHRHPSEGGERGGAGCDDHVDPRLDELSSGAGGDQARAGEWRDPAGFGGGVTSVSRESAIARFQRGSRS